jgi:hypothetical protein
MNSDKHSFSIEMISKDFVNRISISNEPNGEVLLEGQLGEITHIELVEGIMLQITGDNGVFRIDITEGELYRGLFSKESK